MEAHEGRLNHANIPKRFIGARLSDFNNQIIKDIEKFITHMNDNSKKETYRYKGAEIFQKVGVLIIDEMGRSFTTDAEKNRLFDIINYRYENLLPTVILANKGKDELFHSIGEGVADRLREEMQGLVLTGKSWRK